MESGIPYEIEIRYPFESPEEAYKALPFIRSCIQYEVFWTTTHYGLSLFKTGQLLRISEVINQGKTSYYLGWKGPDIGDFANIRHEIDEDITAGIVNSSILLRLGGVARIEAPNAVIQELERLGYRMFMSFTGRNMHGYNKSLGINIKVMACPVLKWPIIVELEMIAGSEREARRCESQLQDLNRSFHLEDCLLKEEPCSLLYAGLFSKE